MADGEFFGRLLRLPVALPFFPSLRVEARCGDGFLDRLVEMAAPRDLQRLNQLGLEWELSPVMPARMGMVRIGNETCLLDARTPEERHSEEGCSEERRRDETPGS